MRCARRCQTHPALCEGRKCADFLILLQRKIDIGLMHQSNIHGLGNKAHSYSRDRRGVQGDRKTQGTGTELAGLRGPAIARKSQEVNIKILPSARNTQQGKDVLQMKPLLDSIYNHRHIPCPWYPCRTDSSICGYFLAGCEGQFVEGLQ